MSRRLSFFSIFLISIWSCGQQHSKNMNQGDQNFTNELINETSPYLLEHAHNPVNWHPWGEKALEKAKKENKPLIISIGYAACHWCHVMEKESFSDTAVARVMNDNFICIKVDREERPDIDQIYMDACQMVTGSGGWPLNAFALPDGKPFYAGTYFPKAQWTSLLQQLDRAYKEEYEKVYQQAENITQGISQMDLLNLPKEENKDLKAEEYQNSFQSWRSKLDLEFGGFKRAPKFPLPTAWEFMLAFADQYNDAEALFAVEKTLLEMGKGGIYDQIGGGFARYSTDSYWRVPHFEKMLYDNAQLISLYSKAFKKTKNQEYAMVIRQSIEFVNRELKDPKGGYYSSLNADSEGEEGKFYVWSDEELLKILNEEEYGFCQDYFNTDSKGNWEHKKNILFRSMTDEEFESRNEISKEEFENLKSSVGSKLMAERDKRIRPSTDDKILCSWNAMMISALVDASLALKEPEYLQEAIESMEFLRKNMGNSDNSLFHNFKEGKATISGFLEDYAFMIKAGIDLYQATLDIQWLDYSNELCRVAVEQFHDPESGLFFFTSTKGEKLVARKIEIPDNVIPSSNSVMAKNLKLLGHFFFNEEYLEMSEKMLYSQIPSIPQGGAYYSNWASLWGCFVRPFYEVAIVGPESRSLAREIQGNYLQNLILLGGEEENLPLLESKSVEGKTLFYVCKERVCDLPVEDLTLALEQIKNSK